MMLDPRFAETVVYICAHNHEGAMGLIINQPLKDLSLKDILSNTEIPLPAEPLPPVYLGGPVETNNVCMLYSTDYTLANHLAVSPLVAFSRDPRLLRDLAVGRGPRELLVTLGYSGWRAGQLEAELSVDGWLALPAIQEIIFTTPPARRWRQAAAAHGIDIGLFGNVVGSA
ncbi:MAG: YqgE/AlgH family protein [Desulfobulbaceae bacterium]|nr:MAG: YqgE/AlgH family protein [Desulfobulbaceae bacterium]